MIEHMENDANMDKCTQIIWSKTGISAPEAEAKIE